MNDGLWQGIINALVASAGITALIGSGSDARIFRQIVPTGTLFPYCYMALARPSKDTWYYGGGGRDRAVHVAVGFVGRNDTPTADRDVVLLDGYADAALTNLVVAPGLISFRREGDVPDGTRDSTAIGTVDYVSAGGFYLASFQL